MSPDTIDLLTKLGQAGFAIALLYVVYLVGMRMVASNDRATASNEKNAERTEQAIGRLGDKIDAHREADVASHSAMQSDIAELDGKISGLLDGQDRWTPVGVEPPIRQRTPVQGVSIGAYGPRKPGGR